MEINLYNEKERTDFINKAATDLHIAQDEFLSHVMHSDFLVVVIRGHLYVEHELNNLIKKTVKHASSYNERIIFSQKMQLAHALGCIDEEIHRVIDALNNVRNRYAHNIKYNLTEQHATDFINVFKQAPGLKAMFDKRFPNKQVGSWEERFRYAITHLWLYLKETDALFHYQKAVEDLGLRARIIAAYNAENKETDSNTDKDN
ncbi:hypothetical protein [Priestia megaterium]|uniref:hypothetical protein n=1 Tax=Priestia megaterium TaxID=1404 RepID=UPI002E247757|nr:hypothetical protein [Priestia megaterium]